MKEVPEVTMEPEYQAYDRPTAIRNQATATKAATAEDTSMDYLDIPAFLRRQAD